MARANLSPLSLLLAAPLGAAAVTIDFADVPLAVPPAVATATGVFFNGGPSTNASGWSSGGALFSNSYNSSFGGFWSGFAYSTVTDQTTPGFTNQYAALHTPSGGGSGDAVFALAYADGARITLPPAAPFPVSIDVTNTTYAGLSMRDGDAFSKKFGGTTGNDPDFFSVTITALDGADTPLGSIEIFLADFRFADNAQDYLIGSWTTFDLSALGAFGPVSALQLSFASSDVSTFGINTPTYVAIDNLVVVPEPGSLAATLAGAALATAALRRRRSST